MTGKPTLLEDMRIEFRILRCALLGHKPAATLTDGTTAPIEIHHWTCRRCHTELHPHYRNDTYL